MNTRSIIIAGTGQAGFQAAASLRQEGFDGEIVMIGDEPGLPYQRPPLSKAYLKEGNAERLLFRNAAFFDDNAITLADRTRIERIARRDKLVELEGGRQYHYDHLVLATGARNRKLPLQGGELEGVVELRTVAHADMLREQLTRAGHVIIIGGGFIGLEFASVANALGVEVTVLEAAPRLMARVVCEEVSEDFLAVHRNAGVAIHLGTAVSRIVSDDGHTANGVELADGQRIGGDLILVAAGAVANSELAGEAGLTIENGISVDETLMTSDQAISAIGDCASHIDPRSGNRVRLESVQNAADQAKCVAARIAGRSLPYAALPWFWSDQGDRKLQIVGLTADADKRIAKEPQPGRLSVFCFRDGRLIGLETVNSPGDHMAARKIMGSGRIVTFGDLEDRDFSLKALRD